MPVDAHLPETWGTGSSAQMVPGEDAGEARGPTRAVTAPGSMAGWPDREVTTDDLVDAAPDGILLADETGRMLVANRRMEELFGYSPGELLGQPVEMLMPEADRLAHREHRARHAAEPAARPMGTGLVLTGLRRDGSRFPVEISLSPLCSPAGSFTIATVRDVTDRVAAEERLRRAERDMAVGDDRQRIARDLHDRTIQRLFATGLAAQSLYSRVADATLRARLEQVVADLDTTILDLRSSIFELSSSGEVRTFRARVLGVCADEQAALGFAPSVRFTGPVETVGSPAADELVVVLREALSNVGRHARATEVAVTVAVGRPGLGLLVDDDGRGPPGDVEGHLGNGLANMRIRAQRLGGTFLVAAREPRGTRLEWRVPLH